MPFGGEITSATARWREPAEREERRAPRYVRSRRGRGIHDERVVDLSPRHGISRAFPLVRSSLSSADFHSDIRDDDERACRLANPWRSWTTSPWRCARARWNDYPYYIPAGAHESIALQWTMCAKTTRLASRARNTKVSRTKVSRIIFLRSAFPPPSSFRPLADFPASPESRDGRLDPVEATTNVSKSDWNIRIICVFI